MPVAMFIFRYTAGTPGISKLRIGSNGLTVISNRPLLITQVRLDMAAVDVGLGRPKINCNSLAEISNRALPIA